VTDVPLYEYECDACGQRVEIIQKFSDPPPDACAKCGKGPVRRLKSSPAIQFKGSGWYITDYAQKGKSGGDGSATEKTESKKADSGSSDTPAKPDAAPTSDATSASSPAKPASDT
jgi:putative FmdB family regulatory protein